MQFYLFNYKFSFLLAFVVLFITTTKANSLIDTSKTTTESLLKTKVSFNFRSTSIKETFRYLGDKYQIDFIYIEEKISLTSTITASAKEIDLSKGLDLILKNTDLTYFVIEDQIVISKKELTEELEIDTTSRTLPKTSTAGKNKDSVKYKQVSIRSFNNNKKYKVNQPVVVYLKRNKNAVRKLKKQHISRPSLDSLLVKETLYVKTDSISIKKDTMVYKKVDKNNIPKQYTSSYKAQKHHSSPLEISFEFAAGRSKWKNKINDPEKAEGLSGRNKYYKNTGYSSFSLKVNYRLNDRWLLRTGLGVKNIQKNGEHTNYYINRFYSQDEIVVKKSYEYLNKFVMLPIGFGYKTGFKRIYTIFSGELQFNFFTESNLDYYPVYETQYFANIIPGSTGNWPESPYTDKKNNLIYSERASYKKAILSFALRSETSFIISNSSSIYIGPEIIIYAGSIYKDNAPVKERPANLNLFLGYKYCF